MGGWSWSSFIPILGHIESAKCFARGDIGGGFKNLLSATFGTVLAVGAAIVCAPAVTTFVPVVTKMGLVPMLAAKSAITTTAAVKLVATATAAGAALTATTAAAAKAVDMAKSSSSSKSGSSYKKPNKSSIPSHRPSANKPSDSGGQDQPPIDDGPNSTSCDDDPQTALLKELLRKLKKLIERIHNNILRMGSREPTEFDRQSRREDFRDFYRLIDRLILNGAELSFTWNNGLIIDVPNVERYVIETAEIEIPYFFDVNDQLELSQRQDEFPIDTRSICPTILQSNFQQSGWISSFSLSRTHCQTTADVIYGVHCRICRTNGIEYVGQNQRTSNGYCLHNRMCIGHRNSAKRQIERGNKNQQMYDHVAQHYHDGHLEGCSPSDAFRQTFMVILLPTGESMQGAGHPTSVRRSWEIFWQWILRAREHRGGWSQR